LFGNLFFSTKAANIRQSLFLLAFAKLAKTHCIYLPVAEFETAPATTKENPHLRPPVKANTFTILETEPM